MDYYEMDQQDCILDIFEMFTNPMLTEQQDWKILTGCKKYCPSRACEAESVANTENIQPQPN